MYILNLNYLNSAGYIQINNELFREDTKKALIFNKATKMETNNENEWRKYFFLVRVRVYKKSSN